MKKLILPATGFELPVLDNFYYHDDGAVRSIALHREKLYIKYGKYFDSLKLPQTVDKRSGKKQEIKPKGMCLSFYPWEIYNSVIEAVNAGEDVNCHIFFSYRKDGINTTMSKGHEESEIVLFLGRMDLIKAGIEKHGIGTIGFETLPKEAKCDLGGLCALLREYELGTFTIGFNLDTKEIILDYLRRNTQWGIK